MLSLGEAREPFSAEIGRYFARWASVLARVLQRLGRGRRAALSEAYDAIAAVQGALVLARSLDDPRLFRAALARTRRRLLRSA